MGQFSVVGTFPGRKYGRMEIENCIDSVTPVPTVVQTLLAPWDRSQQIMRILDFAPLTNI